MDCGSVEQAVTSGANPIAIKKGIDKTCDFLISKLRENAKPVQGTQDIKVISTLSCLFTSSTHFQKKSFWAFASYS